MTRIPDQPIDYPPRRCTFINSNHEQCPFFALPGSHFCQDGADPPPDWEPTHGTEEHWRDLGIHSTYWWDRGRQ